jgi:hypothetical protein
MQLVRRCLRVVRPRNKELAYLTSTRRERRWCRIDDDALSDAPNNENIGNQFDLKSGIRLTIWVLNTFAVHMRHCYKIYSGDAMP